jgi:hypothetical protein
MAVEVYPGPGTEARRSPRFAVTAVDDVMAEFPAFVQYAQRACAIPTIAWSEGTTVSASYCTVGVDMPSVLRVELLDHEANPPVPIPITSAVVYPKGLLVDLGVTQAIVAGALELTAVPAGVTMHIEVNGERKHFLVLSTDDFAPAVPPGAINYFDEQPSFAASGTVVYFPPGIHTVGLGWVVQPNATLLLAGGAIVIGTINLKGGRDDVLVHGRGTFSGEFIEPETIALLPFDQKLEYAGIHGVDYVNWNFSNVVVRGITIIRMPFYMTSFGVNVFERVKVISFWHWENDGFRVAGDYAAGYQCSITDCYSMTGDDNVVVGTDQTFGDVVVTRHLMVNAQASPIQNSYFGWDDYGFLYHFVDCTAMSLCPRDNDDPNPLSGFPFLAMNAIVKTWVDRPIGSESQGSFGLKIENLRVEGPCEVRILSWENREYPPLWMHPTHDGDQRGQISRFVIEGLEVEEPLLDPGNRSRIIGFDANNAPHHLTISGFMVDGVSVTAANWATYVEVNAFPYGITLNGTLLGAPPPPPPPGGGAPPVPTVQPPIPFIVEAGTGAPDANSYASIAVADAYHRARGNPTAWSSATVTRREELLRLATHYLDLTYANRWVGWRKTQAQSLAWPRAWGYDRDGFAVSADTVPGALQRATSEAALLMLTHESTMLPETRQDAGIRSTSVSLGPISEAIVYQGESPPVRFPVIDRILEAAGLIQSGSWAMR